MFERLVEWCAQHRGAVIAVALVLGGIGTSALRATPLDAIPDLTDPQVIVFTEWMGRGPELIEDQITYPLVTSFLAAPQVTSVRGISMFGMSFIYVLFEEGTDLYWARSRILEYLSEAAGELPPGVTPTLGPDATAMGWVYMYTLHDSTGQHDLQQLRAFQDFTLRYALEAVPGVSEVAAVGGYVKEYQVVVDPARLEAFDVSLPEIVSAVRRSNQDVGGGVIERGGRELVVRGRGYVQALEDLEQVVVRVGPDGNPVRVQELGWVDLAPQTRRGLAEWNGEGETVAGIVIMRMGEDALDVISRVKERLAQLAPAFPAGIELQVAYDRSELIVDSVRTLRTALMLQMLAVLLLAAVFLLHLRSALVALVVLPLSVVVSFAPIYLTGVSLNIMALGGIIIAIGDMVDASIVLVENAHKKIEAEGGLRSRSELVIEAAKEVARPLFGALMVIAVSFLPIFALEAQEGRLFRPLALTKTFAIATAAILSVTLGPALMVLFIRGPIRKERANPINRYAIDTYRPVLAKLLAHRKAVLLGSMLLVATMLWPIWRLGSEFMPPLYEGSYLFMPVTFPNISIAEARRLLQTQDAIFKRFPEVKTVLGKAGRAETATDPAPLSMFETVIVLEPRSQWRPGMTEERLAAELVAAVEMPGMQEALTMPIRARVDMLTTGIRTAVGIKVFGDDVQEIDRISRELETRIRDVEGTHSVFAERQTDGVYLDFVPDRRALARYGLQVMDVMEVVESAIGGVVIDRTIEGRERYPITVRYPRDLRMDMTALERVLVPTRAAPAEMAAPMAGAMSPAVAQPPEAARRQQVPLSQLGRLEVNPGPPMLRNEDGVLAGYIFIDTRDTDLGGYVARAQEAIEDMSLPPGYRLVWTGQFEFLQRVRQRLQVLVPLTLLIVFSLLVFQFRKVALALIVMAAVPVSLVGSFWLLYILGFNTSAAVWVGMIALVGVAAETASVMLVFLEGAYQRRLAAGGIQYVEDVEEAAMEGAALRVRPLLMTVGTNLVGLMPVMVAIGPGADVAKRIATPMMGGLVSLLVLTLAVIPTAYVTYRAHKLPRR